MDNLPKRQFQFEYEPNIDDVIKALQDAKKLGYTYFKPYMLDVGEIDLNVLRIILKQNYDTKRKSKGISF